MPSNRLIATLMILSTLAVGVLPTAAADEIVCAGPAGCVVGGADADADGDGVEATATVGHEPIGCCGTAAGSLADVDGATDGRVVAWYGQGIQYCTVYVDTTSGPGYGCVV